MGQVAVEQQDRRERKKGSLPAATVQEALPRLLRKRGFQVTHKTSSRGRERRCFKR